MSEFVQPLASGGPAMIPQAARLRQSVVGTPPRESTPALYKAGHVISPCCMSVPATSEALRASDRTLQPRRSTARACRLPPACRGGRCDRTHSAARPRDSDRDSDSDSASASASDSDSGSHSDRDSDSDSE